MSAERGLLVLIVEGPDPDLDRLEDVVGGHLVRFAAELEPVVTWTRR